MEQKDGRRTKLESRKREMGRDGRQSARPELIEESGWPRYPADTLASSRGSGTIWGWTSGEMLRRHDYQPVPRGARGV
jgi:hypothetical protein